MRLNLQISKFIPKPLILDSQFLPLPFSRLDFFFEEDTAFDGDVVFRFHVFERGSGVSCLTFECIVSDFDISEFKL